MLNEVLSVLVIVLVVLLFAAALVIFRAMMYGRVPEPLQAVELAGVDPRLVAEHLAEAVRIQTVSVSEDEPPGLDAFDALQRALEGMYPRTHAALKRECVGDGSLLYTWVGRTLDLEPVLLCGHLDVVPFDPATRADWTRAPFSGDVIDGFVWGRGTLEGKSVVIGIFEAVEELIRAGYHPERTLYIALGHDEELGGRQGAGQIAALLAGRGEQLAAVLDEGSTVTLGFVPGMDLPAALVGVAEKGYATYELKVEGRPGHSALPPKHTAVGVLARAVTRLEQSPMPARLSMARLMYGELGAFLPFSMRLALANPALFGRGLRRKIESSPQGAALARTTLAVTMIGGGVKENILPSQGRAAVNCRLLPGDTRAKVQEHIRRAVSDEAVQIRLDEERSWEASTVSSLGEPAYLSLSQVIREVFPEAAVAPTLTAGATDSRHYAALSRAVYRFAPQMLDAALLKTIHGVDERIPVENLARMVTFYHLLIKSWTSARESQAE